MRKINFVQHLVYRAGLIVYTPSEFDPKLCVRDHITTRTDVVIDPDALKNINPTDSKVNGPIMYVKLLLFSCVSPRQAML